MVLPFLTLYITGPDMQRSLSDAGLVMALFGLGSVAGAFFGGKLSDKKGFYKVQVYSLFFGGILFIVLGQIKSYSLLCVFTFLLSLVNEAFRPANSTAIAFYSKVENRTRSYSLNRLAINLGWSVGASLGGILAEWDYEYLFWVDGLTNLLAAFILFKLFRDEARKNVQAQNHESGEPALSAYKDRVYLFFIALITLFAMGFFQLFTTIPSYLRDHMGLNESFIGLVMAINGLIIVAFEMVLIFRLERLNRNLDLIILGLLFCALSYPVLLFPMGPRKLALIMILLISVGEIITMPFMNTYWTQRSRESNRGQYAALYVMSWGLSQSIGPYISSFVVEWWNFETLFFGAAMVFSLCALGFYLIKTEEMRLRGQSLK